MASSDLHSDTNHFSNDNDADEHHNASYSQGLSSRWLRNQYLEKIRIQEAQGKHNEEGEADQDNSRQLTLRGKSSNFALKLESLTDQAGKH